MAFRIGITIGDVVERDGDLLGDGVNIAARLEGLAEVGGICISRAVHEQVANKLSVQFADIGAQEVKNIPTPVHAYMVAMRREDGTYATPQVRKPVKAQGASQPNWMWPVAVTVVGLAAIGVGGFLYFTKLEATAPSKVAVRSVAPNPVPSAAAAQRRQRRPRSRAARLPSQLRRPRSHRRTNSLSPTFLSSATRPAPRLHSDYVPATGFQGALAQCRRLQRLRLGTAERGGRPKSAAVEQCQKRADTAQSPRKCELYAVGDAVVYAHGRPPMPPLPWIRHDAGTGRRSSRRTSRSPARPARRGWKASMRRHERTRRSRSVPAVRFSFRSHRQCRGSRAPGAGILRRHRRRRPA